MAPNETLFTSTAEAMLSSTAVSVQTPDSRIQDEENVKQQSRLANPIPNGGFHAWLQVFGAFLLFFNSWGIINTFGAFQTYYEFNSLKSSSASSISWIGTVQGFLLIIFGLVGGPAFDKGFYRELIAGGTIFLVFGMMMTSLCTEYYQFFLAQGICVGFGAGAVFLPSVALVATYFSTKRALATGITASGGSVGSVIYTIVFRKLQPRLGFPWATRIIGFIALGTLLISLAIMRSRSPRDAAKKARKLVDLSAFQSIPFNICVTGMFIAFIGLYIPFFDIITYAQTHANVSEDMSFYLLSIMNAASALGRIVPGLLADRFGSPVVLATLTIFSAILVFGWIAIDTFAGLVVFSTLYGFMSGGVVSLPVSTIASFTNHLGQVGTWMGMAFCFNGLGFLIGNPIAGTLINTEKDDYVRAIVFSGATIVGGGIVWWVLWAYVTFIKPKPRSYILNHRLAFLGS